MDALLNLLMSSDRMMSLAENHSGLRAAFTNALVEVTSPKKSPWPFTQVLGLLISSIRGNSLLNRWRLIELLSKLGENCKSAATIPAIFAFFLPPTVTPVASACLFGFLKNTPPDVFQIVLEEMLKMSAVFEDFASQVFGPAIARFAKSNFPPADSPRRVPFIAFLSGLLVRSPKSLEFAAELHIYLRDNARYAYALLFSRPEAYKGSFVADELAWWLSHGNTEYVNEFQAAVHAAHSGDVGFVSKSPGSKRASGGAAAPAEAGR
jgi:hypothetical protein